MLKLVKNIPSGAGYAIKEHKELINSKNHISSFSLYTRLLCIYIQGVSNIYRFEFFLILEKGAQKTGGICKKQFKSVDQVSIAGST